MMRHSALFCPVLSLSANDLSNAAATRWIEVITAICNADVRSRHTIIGPARSCSPYRIVVFLGLVATLLFGSVAPSAAADEPQEVRWVAANLPPADDDHFQVTVEVYEVAADQQLQLQDRHLVIFHSGKVFDFALTEPHDRVTIIDPSAGHAMLLSRIKKVKVTIPHQDLLKSTAKLRLYAIDEGLDERLGINATAEKDAEQPNVYRIAYAGYRYIVTAAAPDNLSQPDRFAEFTDWVARINLIQKLGTPPFARMALGRTIATDGLVPDTVQLELKSDTQSRTFQSKYTFKHGLSPEGKKRVDEVLGMMALYREVPLPAFPSH